MTISPFLLDFVVSGRLRVITYDLYDIISWWIRCIIWMFLEKIHIQEGKECILGNLLRIFPKKDLGMSF